MKKHTTISTIGGAFLLLTCLFLHPLSGEAKKIYITKGSDNGRYLNASLVAYAPGDTFVLTAQQNPYSYFALDGINGAPGKPVVIINEGGQVSMSDGINLANCNYIKITGGGSGDQYGFKIAGSTSSGIGIDVNRRSSDVEVERMFITSKLYGFWVKHDVSCDASMNFPNWRMNNISLHHNMITNMGQEAFYLGSTNPNGERAITCNGVTSYPKPMRLGNVKVYNNIIDNMRRGGIMLSGADLGNNEIYNNTITNVGFELDPAQGTGIILGGYTHAYVHDNTINNSYSTGIFSLGSGEIRIENNRIDNSGRVGGSTANGMASIMIDTRQTSPVENTSFIVKNNVLGSNTDRHIRVYNAFMTYNGGNLICNNSAISGALSIGVPAGIDWSNCAGGNQPPVPKAGIDQTIVLPINYAVLSGSATDADGLVTTYTWTKISGPSQGTINAPNSAQTNISNLAQGVYVFRLSVADNSAAVATDDIVITVNNPPAPTSYFQIPTRVEAESWGLMNGVQTENTADLGGGVHVAYIDIEDWMDYYVNAPSAGNYTLNLRIANPNTGARFHIKKPDGTLITTVNIPTTGSWQTWQTASISIPLAQGQQTLRFESGGNSFNFNWFELTQGGVVIPPPPPAGVYVPIPGKLEAENWISMQGVQTEGTSDAGGGLNVGYIDNTDYMTYNVNAPAAGTYTLRLRLATPNNGAQLQIRAADGSTLASVSVANTGGYQNWQTKDVSINLPQGQQTLKVISTASNAWNINWLEFTSGGSIGNSLPVASAGGDQSITLPTSSVQLSGSGTDVDGSITSYVWNKVTGPAGGLLSNTNIATTNVSGLVAGTYVYRLTVTDNAGASASDEVSITVNPLIGTPSVSGRIEAENWSSMSGVQTENTSDAGGGLNVGYIDNGDWMEYSYNASAAGTYKVSLRLATPNNAAVFQIRSADGSVLATVNVPNTGSYQAWQTVDATVSLPQGQQTLRLRSTASDPWNINWLELVPQTNTPPPPPPAPVLSGNYVVIPARIQAENWSAMSGVQTETTTDEHGGLNVGYIDKDDWMEYRVNAPVTGTYMIRFRIATPHANSEVALLKSDGSIIFQKSVPNTGSFQSWNHLDVFVTLQQGPQTLRVLSKQANWNFNWIEFFPPSGAIAPPPPPTPSGTGTTARIEAENWSSMNGVQTEGTSDAGGGLNVGYIDNGDWMDYAYNAPVSGTYTINFRVASGGRFSIAANGSTVGSIAWENTGGFQTWRTFSTTVNLSQGAQTIRLTAISGTANINWIEIIAPGAATTAHLATGTEEAAAAAAKPGTETTGGAKAAIRVFPNPIEERFTLQLNSDYTGSVRVVIRDTKGSAVKGFTLTKGAKGAFQAYLSLQGVPAGTYTLSTYQSNEQTQSIQIIKR